MTASTPSSNTTLSHVEHFVVFFLLAFLAQVTIGGHALNVTDSTGLAAAVSGVLSAVYVAFRAAIGQ